MQWRKVTLIGVGLLGGSLGLALRKRGLARQVHGYVRRETSITECLEAGAVDQASTDLGAAVSGADLIVFCTPLAQMPALAKTIGPLLNEPALITDVGSVKGPLVAELDPILRASQGIFVGSHPMAGSEKMGVSAARADLFLNSACVVTPTSDTDQQAVSKIEELWRSVGARVTRMSPDEHDHLVSRTSHLPHVLAAQLAAFVLESDRPEQSRLCANGFRDSTRIASGSPEMWRDIVVMNQAAVLEALDQFSARMLEFRNLLEGNDPARIEEFFRRAKTLRDGWANRCASSSPE